jgi:TPR repeat protein
MNDNGFIYVLINPSMPGMLKIGKTNRDPNIRLSELSNPTGIPTPFFLAYTTTFYNCTEAEKMIHAILGKIGERVSDNREFFKAELNDAINAILEAKKIDENREENILNPTKEILFSTDDNDSNINSIKPIWEESFTLAENYYYGNDDFLQDYEEALNLYKQAANLGAHKAYYMIGKMYKEGKGCSKDLTNSLKYFKKGASKNVMYCYAEMATVYQEEGHLDNAFKCWNKYIESQIFLEIINDNDLVLKTLYLFSYTYLCIIHNEYELDKLKIRLTELSDDLKMQLNESIHDYTDNFLELILSSDESVESVLPLIKIIPQFRELIYEYNPVKKNGEMTDSERIELKLDLEASNLAINGHPYEAIDLYLKAIDQGSKYAPQRLAELYSSSHYEGLDIDIKKAIHYLNIGVNMGNDNCYWHLGCIYDSDLNNYKKALNYWFKYFNSNAYTKNDENIIFHHTFKDLCTFNFIEKCYSKNDKTSLKRFISLLRSFPSEIKTFIKKESLKLINKNIKDQKYDQKYEGHYLNNIREYSRMIF